MLDSNRLQRLQQAPLWDFACEIYAIKDVEQACLILQDNAAVDVCELLFHGWLFHHGLKACRMALREERARRERWQQDVTQTLRALRRCLKSQAAQSASIHQLRETIKRAELQAEKENLSAWQAFALGSDNVCSALDDQAGSRADNLQEVAVWLQSRLSSRAGEPCAREQGQALSGHDSSVETAWRTIALHLDPIKSAR
ncbi:TIGR02444 family protein [Vreelandella sp. EE22]